MFDKAFFKERAKAVTAAWAIANGYDIATPTRTLSEPEQKLKAIFDSGAFGFGDGAKNMAKVIEILSGHKVGVPNVQHVRFVSNVVVVPTGNDNQHDYEIGQPAWSRVGTHKLRKMNGAKGNIMTANKAILRPATAQEIDTFFDAYAAAVDVANTTDEQPE
jgi:hypothetical protein